MSVNFAYLPRSRRIYRWYLLHLLNIVEYLHDTALVQNFAIRSWNAYFGTPAHERKMPVLRNAILKLLDRVTAWEYRTDQRLHNAAEEAILREYEEWYVR